MFLQGVNGNKCAAVLKHSYFFRKLNNFSSEKVSSTSTVYTIMEGRLLNFSFLIWFFNVSTFLVRLQTA